MHDYGITNTEEEVILAPLESNGLVPYLLLRWQHLVSLGYHTVALVWSMSELWCHKFPDSYGSWRFFLQIWEADWTSCLLKCSLLTAFEAYVRNVVAMATDTTKSVFFIGGNELP